MNASSETSDCERPVKLKEVASAGLFWNAVDRLGVQAGQLAVGVVLANLLSPSDFGLIGLLSIFHSLSEVFVDSGMEKGLVQKHDRSDVDFVTVFWFNLVVSLLLYIVLFFLAPLISDFYESPELTSVCRVLSLIIVANALAIVQRAQLIIAIDFRTLAKARLISFACAAVVAVYLANRGFGVWALVWQLLGATIATTSLLWLWGNWRPSIQFSRSSFAYLWTYGYRILLSGLYGQGMVNAYNLVIGKYYSSEQLGFYTNARKYAEVSAGSLSGILQQVTFPILASIKNDPNRLAPVYRQIVRMTQFVAIPTMVLIAVLADPIVRVLFKEEWYPMISLLQIMCCVTVFYPVSVLNLNLLNAVGRSDLFLRTNVLKSPVMIGTLVITLPMGVTEIVVGQAIASFLGFCVNTYYPGKLIGYGLKQHIRDSLPFAIGAGLMALAVTITSSLTENSFLQIAFGTIVAAISYAVYSMLMQFNELDELKTILRRLASKW